MRLYAVCLLALSANLVGQETPAPDEVRKTLTQYYSSITQLDAASPSKEQITLGRSLFYDKRLSRGGAISCNDCHDLTTYGTGGAGWVAYKKQHPDSRSPQSMYHAAHLDYSYWDGRIKHGDAITETNNPFLNSFTNSNEMALTDITELEKKLKKIKGYTPLFKNAFPDDPQPLNGQNAGLALSAFSRGLTTPAPIDHFLDGEDSALTADQLKGAQQFISNDCAACHTGPFFGGQMIQKLGVVRPWPNQADLGYFNVTGNPNHKMFFRVAPLRNVEQTAPYFHDDSGRSLLTAVYKMAMHESGRRLEYNDMKLLAAFLNSFTGKIPEDYIEEPELPK